MKRKPNAQIYAIERIEALSRDLQALRGCFHQVQEDHKTQIRNLDGDLGKARLDTLRVQGLLEAEKEGRSITVHTQREEITRLQNKCAEHKAALDKARSVKRLDRTMFLAIAGAATIPGKASAFSLDRLAQDYLGLTPEDSRFLVSQVQRGPVKRVRRGR